MHTLLGAFRDWLKPREQHSYLDRLIRQLAIWIPAWVLTTLLSYGLFHLNPGVSWFSLAGGIVPLPFCWAWQEYADYHHQGVGDRKGVPDTSPETEAKSRADDPLT
jgi:hypothetical protein